MEAFKKTYIVPANHQLHMDITLPDTFPAGETEVYLIFSSKIPTVSQNKRKELLKFSGSLENSSNFGDDPLAFQKEIRNEWNR
jgi:hypothetical protein